MRDPCEEVAKSPHGMHPIYPLRLLYVSAGQRVQLSTENAANKELYVPAGQGNGVNEP